MVVVSALCALQARWVKLDESEQLHDKDDLETTDEEPPKPGV